MTYKLVDVIDAEIADPTLRRARREWVRDVLWSRVFDGTFSDFDEALASYAEGRLSHGFAHVDESRPEACLCGAMFVEGYHLDVVKRAHLEAVTNA